MSIDTQLLGKAGEELACAVLKKDGYHILARNYKTKRGELDIVAKQKRCISFIEVKSRTAASILRAQDALTQQQMKRIYLCSLEYINERLHKQGINTDELKFSYDVAAIEFTDGGGVKQFQYFKNYFQVMNIDLCGSSLRYGDTDISEELDEL